MKKLDVPVRVDPGLLTPETKCGYCTNSKCCTYVTQGIDAPRSKHDFEHLLWQVSHEHVKAYKDSDGWCLLFETTCRHLLPNGKCGIYEVRPQICRESFQRLLRVRRAGGRRLRSLLRRLRIAAEILQKALPALGARLMNGAHNDWLESVCGIARAKQARASWRSTARTSRSNTSRTNRRSRSPI